MHGEFESVYISKANNTRLENTVSYTKGKIQAKGI